MDSLARLAAAMAATALAATLSACAAQAPSGGTPHSGPSVPASPSAPAPGPGSPSAPVAVVHLASGFEPRTLRLTVGESFLLILNPGFQASVPPPGSLLTERPVTTGRYLYTARAAGDTTLSTFVKPRCPPGAMCPQWIALARLAITIGS